MERFQLNQIAECFWEIPKSGSMLVPARIYASEALLPSILFAFANRQTIAHHTSRAFSEALGRPALDLGLRTVYEVAHNIAKFETHEVAGRQRRVCVHRKGATRAFAPLHPELPGRRLSRRKSRKVSSGRNVEKELAKRGIFVRGDSWRTIHEEIPESYKDVAEVVDTCQRAGISKKVAQLRPLGCIKG